MSKGKARTPSPLRKNSQGYYVTQWTDDNGKRHTTSFGRDEGEAVMRYQAWVGEWYADHAVRNPGNAAWTIDMLVKAYGEHADQRYRRPDGTPTGEADNLRMALRDLQDLFGAMEVRLLAPVHLRAYRERLAARGIVRRSINKRVKQVLRCLRWATAEGVAPVGVHERLKALEPLRPGELNTTDPPRVKAAPMAHVNKTMDHLPDVLRDAVQLLIATGMRPGELCAMTPADIDTTGAPWTYRPGQHKNAHRNIGRDVWLGPDARAIVERYVSRDLAAPLFNPAEAQAQRDARRRETYRSPGKYDYRVMPSYIARRAASGGRAWRDHYTTRTLNTAIRRACEAAGVPVWSVGQLRHNAAQRIEAAEIANGTQPHVARHMAGLALGHSQVETTAIYAERNQADVRLVIERAG